MTILVNNRDLELPEGTTLQEFLVQYYPPVETTYVWRNREFISRFSYSSCLLQDQDRLKVYRVVSGG